MLDIVNQHFNSKTSLSVSGSRLKFWVLGFGFWVLSFALGSAGGNSLTVPMIAKTIRRTKRKRILMMTINNGELCKIKSAYFTHSLLYLLPSTTSL